MLTGKQILKILHSIFKYCKNNSIFILNEFDSDCVELLDLSNYNKSKLKVLLNNIYLGDSLIFNLDYLCYCESEQVAFEEIMRILKFLKDCKHETQVKLLMLLTFNE